MKTFVIFSFILLCHICLGLEKPHPSKLRRAILNDAPNAVKVFKAFPSVVLVSDPVNGTILDCLRACQTDLNPEIGRATYTWILPKIGQIIPLHVKAEEQNSGEFTYSTGDGSPVKKGKYHYTDYRTCVVMDIDFRGYQCLLLATPGFEDKVPHRCVDHFLRTCGSSAKLRSRDHCKDVQCAEE